MKLARDAGFVGARRAAGRRERARRIVLLQLPLALAIAPGLDVILLGEDVARSLGGRVAAAQPRELPSELMTVAIGAPYFLLLMVHATRRR